MDITGDGRPEIVCSSKGRYGYASPNPKNPTAPFTWHPLSPDKKYHRFTHGLGVGDVNGDGRMDLLEKDGWWEQPASLTGDPEWQHHPVSFGLGGAQMYAYDINGDGLNDVITSLAAHGYGLAWYEQSKVGSEIRFKEHIIMNKEITENAYGVKFSQLHGIDLVDVDGDGLKDIVTGKRFWAHGPTGDAESGAAPVLYWFQLQRGADRSVNFVPHLIDDASGVGTEVKAVDYNRDGLPDIVVGNKKGSSSSPTRPARWTVLLGKPLSPRNTEGLLGRSWPIHSGPILQLRDRVLSFLPSLKVVRGPGSSIRPVPVGRGWCWSARRRFRCGRRSRYSSVANRH